MPDRYERQRDNRDSGQQGSARNRREGGYSRTSSDYSHREQRDPQRNSRDARRYGSETSGRSGSYSRDGRNQEPHAVRENRSASARYASDSRYGDRGSRDYRSDRSRAAQGDRYVRPRNPRPERIDYPDDQRRYRGTQEGRRSHGQLDQPIQRRYAREDAQRRQTREASRYGQQAGGRQPQRQRSVYDQEAFDPRANLQGGRRINTAGVPGGRGSRGVRMSGGMQPQYSFDIADAFQMGKYALVGIVALIIVIFVVRGIYLATPADYTVAGQQVSLARGTTYQGLLDSGALGATPGNLVAVDDEVLQEGGGKQPAVFLNGEQVEDLNSRISDQGDITAENGEDEIEPYTATQEITPITTQLEQANNFNFYNGVLHVVTDPGQEGITETRTGETTGRTATVKVQDMKPRVMENLEASIPSGKKLVAITFDDGPNPVSGGTEEILAVLAKHNAKATFFMLGTQAEEFPEMAKKVADAGHQVATHSYSHDEKHYLNQTTTEDVIYQISTARKIVGEATGTDPAYIRPPGGNIDGKAILAADTLADGYIGWSIDTLDYTLPGSDSIARTILSEVEPGAVVLMHDGGGDRTQTAEALDEAIPKLQEEGYTLVTVDELVQAILAERQGSQQGQAAQAATQDDGQGSDDNAGENADDASGEEGEAA